MSEQKTKWFIDVDGKRYPVRDSKMTPIMDWSWGPGCGSRRIDYGKHGLRRECLNDRIRHYWRRVRVPWIIWAMFR